MKLFKIFSLSFLLSLTAGCGSTVYITKPDIMPLEPSCEVFVFRDSFTLVWSMKIRVNGIAYAKLSDNTYSSFYLEEGEHNVKAAWNFFSGGVNLDVPIECKANETIYIAFFGYVSARYRHIEGGQIPKQDAEKRFSTHRLAGT